MTNAIVSLIENGRTKIKIITGADGYNAEFVANFLRENPNASLEEIYDFAATQFSEPSSLVVMSKGRFIYKGDEDLPASYFETFENPRWNPRWHYGTAEYTEIVEI